MRGDYFHWLAQRTSRMVGSPPAFAIALAVVALWAILGPLFGFSDTWQLVINTGTTIVTFLIVFLIQNSQNRDSMAIQLKLDELIRASQKARNRLIDLEELSEGELRMLQEEFRRLHDQGERPRGERRRGAGEEAPSGSRSQS